MEDILTRYGTLTGAICNRTYDNGLPREVKLLRENHLHTSVGEITPHYRNESIIHHGESDVLFYPDGEIKYISLMEVVPLETPVGTVPCNSLMFYEDSSLKHAFMRDNLEWETLHAAPMEESFDEINVALDNYDLNGKISGISFYRSGAVKMITIAPCESIAFNTAAGSLRVRNSIAFYENGMVKALEPARPVAVDTPIGFITAYNPLANNGDVVNSSLRFTETGHIRSLVTVNNTVSVMVGKNEFLFSPTETANSYFHELSDVNPIEIKFYHSSIMIVDRERNYLFDLGRGVFDVLGYDEK